VLHDGVVAKGGLPDRAVVRDRLLDALQYEDDQWLWEVVWWMNVDYPHLKLQEKIVLARAVVTDLLAEGVVELRISAGWPQSADIEPTVAQRAAIMAEDAAWFDPEHADLLVQIRLVPKAGRS
jgi:hypothetical protein